MEIGQIVVNVKYFGFDVDVTAGQIQVNVFGLRIVRQQTVYVVIFFERSQYTQT